MLMESFEVENFRSLKHLKLEKLARVNLLVGKNNSGKTSVLEAIFAIVGVGGPDGFSIVEQERGLSGDKADFRYLFYGFDIKKIINITVGHRDTSTGEIITSALLSISIEAKDRREINIRETSHNAIRKSAATILAVKVNFSASSEPIYFEIRRSSRNQIYVTPTPDEVLSELTEELDFPSGLRYSNSEILTTTIDRTELSQKVETLKFNKSESILLQLMRNIDQRIESIELGAGGQIYFDLGENFRTLLPLNLMGEGAQRLLDIISAMASRRNSVVLIDEIDNGLHYSALRFLWKGILQASREYDVQVFATTHSAEALRHLTWVLDDKEYKSYRDDIAAYTLIRAKDDTVRSYRYDYEQLDYAMEHDMEIRN